MNLRPLGNQVIVRRDKAGGKSRYGIWIPETEDIDPKTCTVLAVGSKVTEIKPGDKVIIIQYDGHKFDKVTDSDLEIVEEKLIWAIVEDTVKC